MVQQSWVVFCGVQDCVSECVDIGSGALVGQGEEQEEPFRIGLECEGVSE